MAFGITFILCLLTTFGLLIYFFISKRKIALVFLCAVWALPILFFLLSGIILGDRSPILLTKQDIIGEYKIDTNFFPGMNARWQYEHYQFFITQKDSIVFMALKRKEVAKKYYKHKIKYSSGPPDLWMIEAGSTNHIIQHQPTLFRGHNKFYYVFHSDKFGNMFFRKVVK